jgi:hypothetical protein
MPGSYDPDLGFICDEEASRRGPVSLGYDAVRSRKCKREECEEDSFMKEDIRASALWVSILLPPCLVCIGGYRSSKPAESSPPVATAIPAKEPPLTSNPWSYRG